MIRVPLIGVPNPSDVDRVAILPLCPLDTFVLRVAGVQLVVGTFFHRIVDDVAPTLGAWYDVGGNHFSPSQGTRPSPERIDGIAFKLGASCQLVRQPLSNATVIAGLSAFQVATLFRVRYALAANVPKWPLRSS